MRDRTRLETLLAELNADVDDLGAPVAANRKADARIRHGANDELDWAALGYTIHNVYNVMESYFLRVSKYFENELPSAAWHRELIDRMTLEIARVRPRLLDRPMAGDFHELRAFRHVFRNMYGASLNPDRVRTVQSRVPATVAAFRAAHDRFTTELRTIAAALD